MNIHSHRTLHVKGEKKALKTHYIVHNSCPFAIRSTRPYEVGVTITTSILP